MKIFKFGGASVKDAKGVKNVATILQKQGIEDTLVIISAMGKMTNAFERLVKAYYDKSPTLSEKLDVIIDFHQQIIKVLFEKNHPIYNDINLLFGQLSGFMASNHSTNYNYIYDQIVCFGELFSTKIVSAYLSKIDVQNRWLDVRNIIETDSNYREANVNWTLTETNIQTEVDVSKLNITQGFLGANQTNQTTTLGREGSDYSAAIFAYCLSAESVTIWKDVSGVLNADPRVFKTTQLLEEISYAEAIEMAFYGASVIHPKTIQPLKKSGIPLYVRSFKTPEKKGTRVSNGTPINPDIPCFIVKKNQILVSIAANDFSFMVENNIGYIFEKLYQHRLKVNLIQNSAISFSVCVEDKFDNFNTFYQELTNSFKIKYDAGATLHTVRHFNKAAIDSIEQKGTVLLKQRSQQTTQLIIK